MEIIIVIIIVGILATIGLVSYRRGAIIPAYEREAQSTLRLIQQAEETYFLERNTYVSCSTPGGAPDCNPELHLNLSTNNWRYNVDGNAATFSAAASPTGADLIVTGSAARAFHINRGDLNPTSGCGGVTGCTDPSGGSSGDGDGGGDSSSGGDSS
jgi:Tfp pilus assembly protein PilE